MTKFLLLGATALLSVSAAHAAVISGVTATATSEFTFNGFDRAASHTVDGSGTDFTSGVTLSAPVDGTMWLDSGNGAYGGINDASPAITFNLGAAYSLSGATVWNYNERGGLADRGIASADVYTSTDGITFTFLESLTLAEAPGTDSAFGQSVGLSGTAQYVELTNFGQFAGDDNGVQGLSEVQFLGDLPVPVTPVPEPASMALLGFGIAGLVAARKRARN